MRVESRRLSRTENPRHLVRAQAPPPELERRGWRGEISGVARDAFWLSESAKNNRRKIGCNPVRRRGVSWQSRCRTGAMTHLLRYRPHLNLPYPKFIDYVVPGNLQSGVCPDHLPDNLEKYCAYIVGADPEVTLGGSIFGRRQHASPVAQFWAIVNSLFLRHRGYLHDLS
jgi:hypothetical protein